VLKKGRKGWEKNQKIGETWTLFGDNCVITSALPFSFFILPLLEDKGAAGIPQRLYCVQVIRNQSKPLQESYFTEINSTSNIRLAFGGIPAG
jgi:hypothetical protein